MCYQESSRFFGFRHTFNDNAVNGRVVKPHRYQRPAFVAIAVFLRHPDNIAHSGLGTWPGNIPVPALFPEQASMLLTEPDKGGNKTLLVN